MFAVEGYKLKVFCPKPFNSSRATPNRRLSFTLCIVAFSVARDFSTSLRKAKRNIT